MPALAPTALRKTSEVQAEDQAMAESTPLPAEEQTELLDMSSLVPSEPQIAAESPVGDEIMVDQENRPKFPAQLATPLAFRRELRKVPIPPHRMTPLKNSWPK